PDLVIVYEAVNEAKSRLVPPESFRRDGTGFRRAWVERDPWWDRSLLVRFFGVQWGFSPRNSMAERTENEWRHVPDPTTALAANLDKNLEDMLVLARHHGIRVLLTSFAHCEELGDFAAEPRFVQGMRENNAAVAALAQRLGVPFYDFAAEMPGDKHNWYDGVH